MSSIQRPRRTKTMVACLKSKSETEKMFRGLVLMQPAIIRAYSPQLIDYRYFIQGVGEVYFTVRSNK